MSVDPSEVLFIGPSDMLKAEFRKLVMSNFGKTPLSHTVTLIIDRYGYSVNIEKEIPVDRQAQRAVIDTWYTLAVDGTLTKGEEGEPLGARLARTIKANTVNPEPNARQLEIEAYRAATGCTEEEAHLGLAEAMLATPSGMFAASLLIKHLDAAREQEELGLNVVDAFELAEVIQTVKDNFPYEVDII